MKIILLLGLLAASTLSPSVQAEEKVWYCMELKSSGLRYNKTNDSWTQRNFETSKFIANQNGNTFIINDITFPCQSLIGDPHILTCKISTIMFNINTINGRAIRAYTLGWLSGDDDAIVTSIKCETF